MSKIDNALKEIKNIQQVESDNRWMNYVHPLVKFLLTLIYIMTVVSFGKYDLTGVLLMFIYPIILFNINEISWIQALKRLKAVLPLVIIIGIFNQFFETKTALVIGSVNISYGVISMVVLMLKGVLTVLATYILILTTSIEKICYALRLLHLPKIFVTEIWLIYRYISLLLEEANRITMAYSLRAPGQKGIHYKVWGPLIGQLLLRTMDRADNLYDSMCLRGYNGEFYFNNDTTNKNPWRDAAFAIFTLTVIILIRLFF